MGINFDRKEGSINLNLNEKQLTNYIQNIVKTNYRDNRVNNSIQNFKINEKDCNVDLSQNQDEYDDLKRRCNEQRIKYIEMAQQLKNNNIKMPQKIPPNQIIEKEEHIKAKRDNFNRPETYNEEIYDEDKSCEFLERAYKEMVVDHLKEKEVMRRGKSRRRYSNTHNQIASQLEREQSFDFDHEEDLDIDRRIMRGDRRTRSRKTRKRSGNSRKWLDNPLEEKQQQGREYEYISRSFNRRGHQPEFYEGYPQEISSRRYKDYEDSENHDPNYDNEYSNYGDFQEYVEPSFQSSIDSPDQESRYIDQRRRTPTSRRGMDYQRVFRGSRSKVQTPHTVKKRPPKGYSQLYQQQMRVSDQEDTEYIKSPNKCFGCHTPLHKVFPSPPQRIQRQSTKSKNKRKSERFRSNSQVLYPLKFPPSNSRRQSKRCINLQKSPVSNPFNRKMSTKKIKNIRGQSQRRIPSRRR